MMKKRLLLSVLVASLFITSALSLNSCKKNDSNADSTPSVVTYVTMDRDDYYFLCPYCEQPVYPIGESDDHWHWFGFGSESPDHYNFDTDDCLSAYVGPFCPYAAEGRRHKHRITYILHGNDGGIHNTWHVGGGGGSGN
ncbi:MAG: hypothetical protein J6T22_04240 [Bacteroidales bacterium]|nr:hypothetical protein [Bacteroidales bacterium]